MANRRPFYETIVDIIRSFTSPVTDPVLIGLIGDLIKKTKIPENHDIIIHEWKEMMWRTRRENCKDSFGVISSLLEQKREAEADAKAKQEAIMFHAKESGQG